MNGFVGVGTFASGIRVAPNIDRPAVRSRACAALLARSGRRHRLVVCTSSSASTSPSDANRPIPSSEAPPTGSSISVEGREGTDQDLDAKYASWRKRIFYSIFTGYASFYLTRNSFTYAAPGLRAALGLTLEQLGIIASVFPLAYGFSKLVAGVLTDRFSARTFMAVGITMTGIINILFGFQNNMMAFCALWFCNGIFQGFGAPPCAKMLTNWYSKSERGTWWGFWNTSHNTGGFIIPLLAGYCVRAFGWQYGMIVPGSLAVFMGLFLYNRIRDSPDLVDLPPVDYYRGEPVSEAEAAAETAAKNKPKPSAKQVLTEHVISNPYVWLLAICYFFVYFVRQGISSWAHIFLLDFKGVANAQEAAFRVSGMEIGGLLGSLASGWTSDRMMRGRRIPVIVLWLLGVIASIIALWFCPVQWRYANWLAVFCMGFSIYGPQMLIGLAGAEIVHKSAVSTTIGLLGWIAYLGASIAGFPLTKIVTNYGWGAYVVSLLGFAVVAILLLLPMWKLGVTSEAKKPLPSKVSSPIPAIGSFEECANCAGTGSVMRLECGPATPAQQLSCKYIETSCVVCDGNGFNDK